MAERYKTAHAHSAVFAAITFVFVGWMGKTGHYWQIEMGSCFDQRKPRYVVMLQRVALPITQSLLYATGFNITEFYVPFTQYIYVLCMELRTYSDYFPVQH